METCSRRNKICFAISVFKSRIKTWTTDNYPCRLCKNFVKDLVLLILKDIFACLFSIHNTISLSCHEQVCLSGLRFERYFSHHSLSRISQYLSKHKRCPMMGEVSVET